MKSARRFWVGISFVFVAMGIAKVEARTSVQRKANDSPPLDGPMIELDPIPEGARRQGGTTDQSATVGEERAPNRRVYAPKEPPAVIVERPAGARPNRRAQWVPGYWEWDPGQSGYAWVGGSWQITPAGSIWVPTRWVRDADGWYRVPGYWSRRRDRAVIETDLVTTTTPSWRTTGPPAEHPIETSGAAPGPDYFFVPGHYQPSGDRLSWVRGFWARVQAGWDWIPARWVRRPDEWQFREGSWVRDPATDDVPISRRTTAAPDGVAPPPEPIEPDPPGTRPNTPAGADRLTPPPKPAPERDDLADPDAADSVIVEPGDQPEVRVRVRPGMPYYVIRPPGSYPYGPGGVVVPGAVPPFVRRLLDRVLP